MMKYLLCLALIWALSILILWVLIFSITRPVNCASFKFQEDAQAMFNRNPLKYKSLDRDNDKIPCEALPHDR